MEYALTETDLKNIESKSDMSKVTSWNWPSTGGTFLFKPGDVTANFFKVLDGTAKDPWAK